MTLVEAVTAFEKAGLEVSFGRDGFVAAAGRREPEEIFKDQGIAWVYDFGFRARKIGATWFFRPDPPPKPAEQYSSLDEVVARGLELFEKYRSTLSR
jgi:hypothetical protein